MTIPSRHDGPSDTQPEAARAWLEGLRAKGPAWRLERTLDLSFAVREMAMAAFDRQHPHATADERRRWMLEQCYGAEVARRYFEARRSGGPR